MVDGERLDLAVLALVARGIEVAAEDAVAAGRPRQALEERLAGLDLRQAVARRGWDVNVMDLDQPGGRVRDRRHRTLGLRGRDRGQLGQLPAAGGQVEEAAAVPKRGRVDGERK